MSKQVAVVQASKGSHRTLGDLFREGVVKHATRVALKFKKAGVWHDITFHQLEQRVQDFANGLLSFGLKSGDRVALFSRNCPEWSIADWANVTTGFVSIPIYDTLTAEKAAYILRDADARVVLVNTKDQLVKIRSVSKKLAQLEHIIVIEDVSEKELKEGEHRFEQVLDLGRAHAAKRPKDRERQAAAVKPSDLATIIYTSGTTGEPKGAVITQSNLTSNVEMVLEVLDIGERDLNLSFLPLSHVFERIGGHFIFTSQGGTVAYAESIEKVPENLPEIKPTILISVPRLYEKIYARIQEKVRGGSFLKRYLFRKALEVGKQYVREKYTLKVEDPATTRAYKRYDKLVFTKLRDRLGGRFRFAVSGGAPLSAEIHEFFTAVGLPIFQGYGLTETPTAVAVNSFKAFRIGSVGKPLPRADVKIAPDGEILVRGPMVFQGYHKKPEATKEAFTKDGYFKTGDIGRIDEDGFLFVTDRKKELIVMSNGKKVAPQPIENDLKTKPGIGMAVLIGDNRQYISVLLSPDFEQLKQIAQRKGIKFNDVKELLTRDEMLALFQADVDQVNRPLSPFEQIKRFKLLPNELSLDGGELTPTLKVKRRVVNEKYKGLIQGLYADGGPKT